MLACGWLSSCIGPFAVIVATGNIGGKVFSPTTTGFVVLDQHEARAGPDGTVHVVKREEALLRIFLSGASFDPEVDLTSLNTRELNDLLLQVRGQDHLSVSELRASFVTPGSTVEASRFGDTTGGTFNFVIRPGPGVVARNATYGSDGAAAIGTGQSVSLQFVTVDLRDQGRIQIQPADIVVEAGPNQAGEPASGQVNLRMWLPIIPEPLGESNLAILAGAFSDDG